MWNKQLVQLLLTEYEKHENLYNARSTGYNDRAKRSKSLTAIYECLKKENPNITIDAIKTKIHILRGQYIKESLKIAASVKMSTDGDDVYVPRLWFYPLMGFLSSHTQSRPSSATRYEKQLAFNCVYLQDHKDSEKAESSTNDEAEVESNFFNDSQPSMSSCSSRSTYANKRKQQSSDDDQGDSTKRLGSNPLRESNDYDWLGQQVIFEINNIRNDGIRRDTAWKIQTILRESILEDIALRKNEQMSSSSRYNYNVNSDVKIE